MDPEFERKKQLHYRAWKQCVFFALTVFSATAVSCSMTSLGLCTFLNRDLSWDTGRTASSSSSCSNAAHPDLCESITTSHGVGFYAWEGVIQDDYHECLGYTLFIPGKGWTTLEPDRMFEIARFSSWLANFFGLFGFLTLFLATCCPLHPSRMICISIYFLFATLFQGLTLLLLHSEVCKKGFFEPFYEGSTMTTSIMANAQVSCSLGTGANMAIAATVIYFWCMLASPGALPPPPIGGNPFEREPLNPPGGGSGNNNNHNQKPPQEFSNSSTST